MEAADIIEYLRDRDLTITLTEGNYLELAPPEKITDELIERLRRHKPAIIEELKREQRRQKVLKMLEDRPETTRRAFLTDCESDSNNVILTVAIRDAGTCELLIPRHKYDAFAVLEAINQTGAQ